MANPTKNVAKSQRLIKKINRGRVANHFFCQAGASTSLAQFLSNPKISCDSDSSPSLTFRDNTFLHCFKDTSTSISKISTSQLKPSGASLTSCGCTIASLKEFASIVLPPGRYSVTNRLSFRKG